MMGAEQKTRFQIDKSKCIRCGRCINTCCGMVLEFGQDGYPQMKEFERFGWRGCWRCQHCLAVCPQGAISIFGKQPEDSFPPPPEEMGEYMDPNLDYEALPLVSEEEYLTDYPQFS